MRIDRSDYPLLGLLLGVGCGILAGLLLFYLLSLHAPAGDSLLCTLGSQSACDTLQRWSDLHLLALLGTCGTGLQSVASRFFTVMTARRR